MLMFVFLPNSPKPKDNQFIANLIQRQASSKFLHLSTWDEEMSGSLQKMLHNESIMTIFVLIN